LAILWEPGLQAAFREVPLLRIGGLASGFMCLFCWLLVAGQLFS
jgi:hypothetical protein